MTINTFKQYNQKLSCQLTWRTDNNIPTRVLTAKGNEWFKIFEWI